MISVILIDLVSKLRRELNLTADAIGVRSSHRPPPTAGEQFIALYGTTINAVQPDLNTGIDFGYAIGVTITRRTLYNPYEMVDSEMYLKDVSGMEAMMHKIIGWIHQDFAALSRWNALIATRNASAPPFIEPLRFKYMDPVPTNVTENWFRPDASLAAAITASQSYPYCGMIMESVFGDCRRLLKLADLQTEIGIL